MQGAGFRVQSLGFRVQGLGFRVQGAGCRVQGAGFRVQGAWFRVQGSGFRVRGHLRDSHSPPALTPQRRPGLPQRRVSTRKMSELRIPD